METAEWHCARHLDSPPNRGFDFEQGDLQLVDGGGGLGGGNKASCRSRAWKEIFGPQCASTTPAGYGSERRDDVWTENGVAKYTGFRAGVLIGSVPAKPAATRTQAARSPYLMANKHPGDSHRFPCFLEDAVVLPYVFGFGRAGVQLVIRSLECDNKATSSLQCHGQACTA